VGHQNGGGVVVLSGPFQQNTTVRKCQKFAILKNRGIKLWQQCNELLKLPVILLTGVAMGNGLAAYQLL
jgi:hypothetical protein